MNILIFIILLTIFAFVSKADLLEVINRSLPAKEAGLMAGVVLGDKTGFEKNFYQKLITSGLIHLVVASGSNVMLLIGGLIELAAGFLGRKGSIVMGLLVGWWYVYIVGWEIPVLRAMLLLTIMYFAQLIGRKYDLWRGIILAVFIMVIGDYRILTSLSFWLSITAYMAIVTIKSNEFVKTVWVSIWIFPIMAMAFGKFSLVSPITNLLVMGMMEMVTILGGVGMMIGLLVPFLGKLILWLTLPWLKYLVVVVEVGGNISSLSIKFNWAILLGYYCLLFYFLVKIKGQTQGSARTLNN